MAGCTLVLIQVVLQVFGLFGDYHRGLILAMRGDHAAAAEAWSRCIDINIKGVLNGIAAVLPVFHSQQSGHVINVGSVASHKVAPGGAVYSGTKFAVKAITEGLRQEAGAIRCTLISPGAIDTELPSGTSDEATLKRLEDAYKAALPAEVIARAMAYAIAQPAEVDVNEIVVRPTVQPF